MKKLIIVGHSVCHHRQRMLGETTAKMGIKTAVIGPRDWGDEHYEPYIKKNFFFRPLQLAGPPSFYSFNLKKFFRTLSTFRPATIYCMEEMFTLFARECMKHAKDLRCPLWFFTWENKVGYRLDGEFDRIEQQAIQDAEGIICGNSLARERMLRVGADKSKLFVLSQTGLDIGLFKNLNKNKIFDIVYHGRMVREKGLPFLESVAKELEIKMLWVGGRGKYHPRYGEHIEWVPYEEIPELINSAKISVQIPFSYNNFYEQMNFAMPECALCELPVIVSDNGSIPENYGGSPMKIIPRGNPDRLKEEIKTLLEDEPKRIKLGKEGRAWVVEHLSLDTIAKKLLKILELA